jgi:uncharacterized protein YbbC (DUF1343 family)
MGINTTFVSPAMKRILLVLMLLSVISSLLAQRVKVGADVLLDKYLDSLKGKNVAVVCNQASVLSNGVHIVDTLLKRGIKIKALLAPEHGIRGTSAAGVAIGNQMDEKTGLPVYSLYGKTQKPTPEMLHDVDVLIFDLQDVGARFFTYASTMSGCMETVRDLQKKMIILDRPNPINGVDIEGPVLDMELISFVGLFPIPVRHGLTLGELAKMIVGGGWLNYNSQVDLWVIPMTGWKRTMWFDDTKLPWVPPSPNIKSLTTATVYPGTCLFEATNVSEGRGTAKPFEWIGAPGVDAERIAVKLNSFQLRGVIFEPVHFTPAADSASAPDPKYKNKLCGGIFVHVTNRKIFKPVITGILMLSVFRNFPKFELRQGYLDRLVGDTSIGEKLNKRKIGKNIFDGFKHQLEEFKKMSSKYLLYN